MEALSTYKLLKMLIGIKCSIKLLMNTSKLIIQTEVPLGALCYFEELGSGKSYCVEAECNSFISRISDNLIGILTVPVAMSCETEQNV